LNTLSKTRGNIYGLSSKYMPLQFSKILCRVVNIWNSLPNDVVTADTINTFKNQLDKYWINQEVFLWSVLAVNWLFVCKCQKIVRDKSAPD